MTNMIITIIEQMSLYMPLTLGAYISFSLMKTPDLSIESAFLIGALFGAMFLKMVLLPLSLLLPAALAASLCGGALVGLTSSLITRYAQIPHLLSSLITTGIFQGIFLLLSGPYVSLSSYQNPLTLFSLNTMHPEFGMLMLIALVLLAFFSYFLKTQLGHSLSIFGSNALFFNYFNISATYVFVAGIILANALAGLAGYLTAQTSNLVELNMGIGKSIFCITALILGRSVIRKKITSALLAPVGLCIYLVLQQLLLKIGFNLKFFTAVQSLVILLALFLFYKKSVRPNDSLGV